MSRWVQDEQGDWVNLALAVRVRFEGAKAQVWLIDGHVATTQNVDALQDQLDRRPPKDNLVGAYRKTDQGIG